MGMSGGAKVPAIGIGLLGLGVVGSAVAKAVVSRHGSKGCAIPLALVAAVVRNLDKKRSIDLDHLITLVRLVLWVGVPNDRLTVISTCLIV